MAVVIKLKESADPNPIRVEGIAEKDSGARQLIARDGERLTGEFPLDNVGYWYNETDLPGAPRRAAPPTPEERLHLAWALTWPGALFDLAYQLLRAQLGLPAAKAAGIDLVVAILGFFLFYTWVVRRAVRLNFPGFRLWVMRGDGGSGTREMSYAESLSVHWLIYWRSLMILLPIHLFFAVLLRGTGLYDRFLWSIPGWLCCAAAGLAILYFWLAGAAVGKRYSAFWLRLERVAAAGLLQ
jgi:hypothetical protein